MFKGGKETPPDGTIAVFKRGKVVGPISIRMRMRMKKAAEIADGNLLVSL